MTHQFHILVGEKLLYLSRCVRAHIAIMKNSSRIFLHFTNFTDDFWQTFDCVPFRIDRPAFF